MKRSLYEKLSDKEIKHAVHELCMAMSEWDATPAVPCQLSEQFKTGLDTMLCSYEKRLKRRKSLQRIAACFAAIIIAFSAVRVASPTVWASVRSWYVNIVSPDRLVYEFNHEENDHVFLVVRPDSLPEGFGLMDLDEGDGYSNQIYINTETGEYLEFSYHWATVRDLKTFENLQSKHGTTDIAFGYKAVVYTSNDISKLCWIDSRRDISFYAESDISAGELKDVFSSTIEIHPPFYEPSWLPEGYSFYDVNVDDGGCTVSYINNESQNIIIISCDDQGETERVFVDGLGESEEVIINSNKATVYWGEEPISGSVLVMIDEEAHMVFVIDADVIDPELVIKIAESLDVVESFSKDE